MKGRRILYPYVTLLSDDLDALNELARIRGTDRRSLVEKLLLSALRADLVKVLYAPVGPRYDSERQIRDLLSGLDLRHPEILPAKPKEPDDETHKG